MPTEGPRVPARQQGAIPAHSTQAGMTTTDSDEGPSDGSIRDWPDAELTHVPRPSMARWARHAIISDLADRYGVRRVDRHWLRLTRALDSALGPLRVDWRQFGGAA